MIAFLRDRSRFRMGNQLALEVFALSNAQEDLTQPRRSSLNLPLLSRVLQLWRHRCCPPFGSPYRLPSLRFIPLRRFPEYGQPLYSRGYHTTGLRCLLSVSHALEAFIRPHPAGLISCRSRPWGSTLQGRYPLAEPFTLSSALALLQFTVLPRHDSSNLG
jgi:hypothetical protein